jgi:probable F420-dependent oxidoreductase
MKFGTTILGVGTRSVPEVASTFEASGFESIWIPEHLVFPAQMPPMYPYTESGYPPVTPDTATFDPWVLLAYVAAATSRIRLGTNVYILPLRHPLITAKSVVTLDRVSGGRAILGVGVGWLPDEFSYLGLKFETRGTRTDSAIETIRRLWSEDVIDVHDEHFEFGPVKFNPKPLQKPGIPIEIGGGAGPALRRAGALGDGWIEIGSRDLDDFRAKLAVVQAARGKAGRSGPFEVTTPLRGITSDDLEGYRRAEEAGVTRIIVSPPADVTGRIDPKAASDWAKRFADEVIASF